MKKLTNVRVFAKNNENRDGFNIYVDFSGQHEFLMFHRHDGLLYNMLKDGQTIRQLRDYSPQKYSSRALGSRNSVRKRAEHLSRTLRHLNDVLDEYLEFRNDEGLVA